jgi:hypothetical protein
LFCYYCNLKNKMLKLNQGVILCHKKLLKM